MQRTESRGRGRRATALALTALLTLNSLPTTAMAAEGAGLQDTDEQAVQSQLDDALDAAADEQAPAGEKDAEPTGSDVEAAADAPEASNAPDEAEQADGVATADDEGAPATEAAPAQASEEAVPADNADEGFDVSYVIQGLPTEQAFTLPATHYEMAGFVKVPSLKPGKDLVTGTKVPAVPGYAWVNRWYTDPGLTQPFNATRMQSADLTLYTAYVPATTADDITYGARDLTVTAKELSGYKDAKALVTDLTVAWDANGTYVPSSKRPEPTLTIKDAEGRDVSFDDLKANATPGSYTATVMYGTAVTLTSTLTVKAVAPAFNLDEVVDRASMVSYVAQKADGTQEYAGDATIGKDNVEGVSDPVQNDDGTWTVTVTLKGGLSAADFNAPSWALDGDPSEYVLDEAASKMTVEFSTESATGTSYYAYGKARASLVFKRKAAQAPAFDLSVATSNPNGVDVTADGETNSYAISQHTATAGEPYQDDKGNWAVDVSIDPAKAVKFYLPAGLDDDAYELDQQASKLTATFRTEGADGTQYKLSWAREGGDQAHLVFVKKAAQAPAFDFGKDACGVRRSLHRPSTPPIIPPPPPPRASSTQASPWACR